MHADFTWLNMQKNGQVYLIYKYQALAALVVLVTNNSINNTIINVAGKNLDSVNIDKLTNFLESCQNEIGVQFPFFQRIFFSVFISLLIINDDSNTKVKDNIYDIVNVADIGKNDVAGMTLANESECIMLAKTMYLHVIDEWGN